MARDDWFRNTHWNEEIAARFEERLQRARPRSRPQYLLIQAGSLTASHRAAALGLLDRYFALGNDLLMASAHLLRGKIRIALGDVDAALASYEAAMDSERVFPNVMSDAWLEYSCLVVEAGISRLYPRALELLERNAARPTFPIQIYRANGARALLLQQQGRIADARTAARAAMAAARATTSGFRYHGTLGLVGDLSDAFARRVAAIASDA